MEPFWLFENALPKSICDIIKQTASQKQLDKATIGDILEVDTEVRNCSTSWIEDPWVNGIMMHHIMGANIMAGWNLDLTYNNYPSNYIEYEGGGHYKFHTDGSYGSISEEMDVRKLSAVLQLSEPHEYCGGEFVMRFDGQEIEISEMKTFGNIIVFPSQIEHKVQPVTSGKRRTLVCWAHGPVWR